MQDPVKVSSQFRSACTDANQGGDGSYERVGRLFVWNTVAAKTATDGLVELLRLATSDDPLRLLEWVYVYYPEHLKHIPAKKYDEFFRGIRSCAKCLATLIFPRPRKPRKSRPLLDRLQASVN